MFWLNYIFDEQDAVRQDLLHAERPCLFYFTDPKIKFLEKKKAMRFQFLCFNFCPLKFAIGNMDLNFHVPFLKVLYL